MHDLKIESDRPAAGELVVASPYDGRELARVPTAGPDHVDDAMSVAYGLFRNRDAWLSIPERVEILTKAAAIMESQVEELTILAASEGGKPYGDSKVEVIRAIDGVHLCIENLRGHPGSVVPLGTTNATVGRAAFTQKEPVGVVVAVSAFNHPLNLIVHQVGPAVATGCPVVVKARRRYAAVVPPVRRDPARSRPARGVGAGDHCRRSGYRRETRHRSARRLLQFHRQRAGRLDAALETRAWRTLCARTRRCGARHPGASLRYGRRGTAVSAQRRLLPCRPGLRIGTARVRACCGCNEAFARSLADAASQLVVGPPEEPATEVGPLIRAAEVDRVSPNGWTRPLRVRRHVAVRRQESL